MRSGPSIDALVKAAQALADQDFHTMLNADLRTTLLDLADAITLLQAQLTRAVDAFDARGLCVDDGCRSTRNWLRTFARLSESAAGDHVRGARTLRDLPALAEASRQGHLTIDHLRHLTRLVQRVGVEPVARVDSILADAATQLDPTDFAQACHRVRAHLDPDGDADKAAKDHDRRYLTLAPFDGMVLLRGQLDPEGGAALMTALDALTPPPSETDPRTAPQRRADALTELARGSLAEARLPTVGGLRPQVGLLITPAQLVGPPPAEPTARPHTDPRAAEPSDPRAPAAEPTDALLPGTEPTDLKPPATEPTDPRPPATEPTDALLPGTEPTDTEPLAARSPDTKPSDSSPPSTQPSSTKPPSTKPPNIQPSSAEPPSTKPPSVEPPSTGPSDTGPPDAAVPNTVAAGIPWALSDAGAPWLNWIGDIPTAVAQRIACDADIWRVVLDPATSLPINVGRKHRLVPHWIRTALTTRDRGCRFPGCRAPAPWTQAHHIEHWAHGGRTDITNLLSLCHFHHILVHEHRWAIHLDPRTGEVTATRPNGIPYGIRDHRSGSGHFAAAG